MTIAAVIDVNGQVNEMANDLIAGTVVFSGDIAMARGNGQAVLTMNNAGMFLYSNCTASGSGVTPGVAGSPTYTASGLTSSPYVGVTASQIGVFSSSTGPSVTVTGSGINLWSVNGNTSFPYANLTSTAWQIHNGSFLFSVSASQLQFSYSGGASATLNSTQLQLAYGNYSATVTSTNVKLLYSGGPSAVLTNAGLTFYSVDGSTANPYAVLNSIGAWLYYSSTVYATVQSSGFSVYNGSNYAQMTSSGLLAVSGSYQLQAYSTGLKLVYSGGPSAVLTSSGLTLYSVDGDSTHPNVSLTAAQIAISNGTLSLNLNGVTTTIANIFDSVSGTYAGLKCQDNASGRYSVIVPARINLEDGVTSSVIAYAQGGTGYVSVAGGGNGFQVTAYSGGTLLYVPGLLSSNPGAGSKLIWYDPVTGNLKYAA